MNRKTGFGLIEADWVKTQVLKRLMMVRYPLLFLFVLLTLYSEISLGQHDVKSVSVQPFVFGLVDNIKSEVLSENRILNIYLPEGFDSNDIIQYPVIYLLDGSADEDFIHISGLVQFYTFEWISLLPKSIVVGIANVDRRRDFTFPTSSQADKRLIPGSGHSEKFMSFIENELQPFIQQKYKGNNDRTLIGQSLGGLFATEVLLTKPMLFNRYIIVSPSLWWDNGSLLNMDAEILKENFRQETAIYIGVGKEGESPGDHKRIMEDDAKALADKLRGTNSNHVNVVFDYLPEENHATIMHQAVSNAFRKIYTPGTKN